MSDGFSRHSVDQGRDSHDTSHDHNYSGDHHEGRGLIDNRKGVKSSGVSVQHQEIPSGEDDGERPEGSNQAHRRNGAENKKKKRKGDRDDGKHELQEKEAWDKIGYSWPAWKKWATLSSIFAVQCSMNFNASVYANGVPLLTEKFGISEQAARVGQMIFLIAYAFGCELWAPWSEELGRWPVLQVSLCLVNIWQLPAAFAPNFATVIVARFLGGISSAGGSVTLGMVADLWKPHEQQFAVAFVVFSSVFGSVIGPLVGPFMQVHLAWKWNPLIQLFFGVAVQAIHFFTPETRTSILLDREAKRRRAAGETNVYGPSELEENRFALKKLAVIWFRPFEMFVREPIVLCCSLLSGFSDALIFTFLEAFTPVYSQWGFSTEQLALAFIPIAIGYFIAYASYFPPLAKQRLILKANPDAPPEMRLSWLLWLAPLEAIGLFGFAWTSFGPPRTPWIAPMLFSALVGIANFAIYMSTIDYMIAAYGPYAASATGGNGLARDFLAGIAALYATPLYTNVGRPLNLQWGSTILGCLAVVVTVPIYIFYWKGRWIREHSKFAQSLIEDKEGGSDEQESVTQEA